MAITITPSPVDFGGSLLDKDVSLSVTVTGTSAHAGTDVTASITNSTGPGAFTVSPAGGKATTTGLVLTIKFKATDVGDATAKLTVKVGASTLAEAPLAAKGIRAVPFEQIGASHLLVEVPDYGATTYVNMEAAIEDGVDPTQLDGGQTVSSYLRLGIFDYERESPAAKQLLGIIPKAGAARDPRSPDPGTVIIAENAEKGIPEVAGTIFVDDVRVRPQDVNDKYVAHHQAAADAMSVADANALPPNTQTSGLTKADDPDHGLTMGERQAESAQLYARGGWRDHSDGNRISTTWGDKVEVIRGNYKMVVLGRQNDPTKSMGWEATGGHIQDHAPGTMPGASFWLEWIDDARFYNTGAGGDGRKGAWLLVNTTENVYQFARTAGNLRTENWGDVHETYIGSSNPPGSGMYSVATAAPAGRTEPGHPGDEGTRGHKVDDDMKVAGYNYLGITPPDENDQVGKIRNNPHIVEKTWAVRIDSHAGSSDWAIPKIVEKTFVKDVWSCTGSSGTRVDDSYSETFAKRTEELTDVEERIVSNTRAGNIVEATTAGTITGATTAANIAELTTAGIHTEVHLGGAHLEMEVGVFHGTLEVGLKGDIQIAGGYEVSIGSLAEFRFDMTKLRFVNKATDLETLQTRLKRTEITLSKDDVSLEAKNVAMKRTMAALSLYLGL